jgi:hypothetical protein
MEVAQNDHSCMVSVYGANYQPDDFDSPQMWHVFGKTQPEKV